MMLFHLFNVVQGEWDQERFSKGRQWYFDFTTVLDHWLPAQRDPRDRFQVVVAAVDPSEVYESEEYIDNRKVEYHVQRAVAEGKTVVGGLWDREGSKQYVVVPGAKNPTVVTSTEVPIQSLSSFINAYKSDTF